MTEKLGSRLHNEEKDVGPDTPPPVENHWHKQTEVEQEIASFVRSKRSSVQ